jgi:hypothetical protein
MSLEDAMLCAHCYADRLGLSKVAGRKGGERLLPRPVAFPRRPN